MPPQPCGPGRESCCRELDVLQLPVGSGVYIYQVEAPGVGQTSGRMIVFMEKERLNNF